MLVSMCVPCSLLSRFHSLASGSLLTCVCWSAFSRMLEEDSLQISAILSLYISLLSHILHLNSSYHCLPRLSTQGYCQALPGSPLLPSQLGNSSQ